MKQNIQKTSDTISEKPIVIWFGLIPYIVKPMTLAQIYAIGGVVESMEEIDLNGNFNAIAKMLQRYDDINRCANIVTLMVFRSHLMRKLFGWHVKRNLTMKKYQRVIEYGALSFRAAFFLTSFSFLKGVKETTKMTNTAEATTRGDSSAQ